MMAGVTALWPIEAKPPIPMVNPTGRVKLLFLVQRRADFHGCTGDQSLSHLWMPQRNPEIHVGSGEET